MREDELPVDVVDQWSGDSDTIDDPLTDCLVQLSKVHGHPTTRTALRAGLPLVNNRLTVALFSRAAERVDMACRLIRRSLSNTHDYQLPAILVLKEDKACILVAMDHRAATARVLLPETGMGESTLPLEELEDLHTGYTIFIRPKYRQERQTAQKTTPQERHWFWGTIASSWRIYRDVLVASFLINVFGLTGPFFTLNVYDRVIPNLAFETLWVLAVGIGVIYLFNLLMKGLRGYFVDQAGKKANLVMSALLFQKVLGLRLEVRPKSVGAFSKNLQQFETIRDFITSFSITALIDLPFMGLGLFAVWYLGREVVFVHLGAILLLALYALLVQVPLARAVEKSFQGSAQKNAILIEGLSGIETIKMLGAESQLQRAWEEAVSYIATWGARSRFIANSVNHLSDFILNLAVVAVVIIGVYQIADGVLSQGGLIALVILTRQAIAPMTQVVSLTTRFHRARTALSTLNQIMTLPVERPAGKTFLHRTECHGGLELQNVSFAYPEQKGMALRNISLSIAPGEKIALIGPIGSGKTTLGKLILGLFDPTDGLVSMDQTDIRQIDPAELRRFIGYVPQDITLFRGTIRDNLTLGSQDVDDSVIIRASQMSGASEFIGRHAQGYDMEIGEQGQGLSGGQRQSVAIARAMLHDPPVLVLDEPTSSMDNRTESRIKERLKAVLATKTLLLITHRGSLLELVDRIVVIDGGTIVADGPRDRVLSALKSGQINC
jgi:ATP-binding cassette, subfamily C, bacterial LapB